MKGLEKWNLGYFLSGMENSTFLTIQIDAFLTNYSLNFPFLGQTVWLKSTLNKFMMGENQKAQREIAFMISTALYKKASYIYLY